MKFINTQKIITSHITVPVLFVILIATHGLYGFLSGLNTCPDCELYIKWADLLIELNFNYPSFLSSVSSSEPPLMYAAWITVLALIKSLLGNSWGIGVFLFNLFAETLTAYAILHIIRETTKSFYALMTAFFLLFISFENFMWITYILSDSGFMMLSTLLVLGIFKHTTSQNLLTSKWLPLSIILLIISLLFRPTALFLIVAIAIYYTICHFTNFGQSANRHITVAFIAVLLAVAVFIGTGIHALIIKNPSILNTKIFSSYLNDVSAMYNSGIIIHDRPDTYHHQPNSWFDYWLITADKFIHYFAITTATFSLRHTLGNILFFAPSYFFSSFAFAAVLAKNSDPKADTWRLSLLCSLVIITFALLHSITVIDYDFRYRLPCLPMFVILASIGVNILEKRWQND